MKRLLAILALGCLGHMTMNAKNKTIELKVVETSDVHGCFFPYDFMERKPLKGTLTRVSSYVNRLRQTHGNRVLLVDNGDILQGQPICYFSNFIDRESPNVAAEVTNYMKYDAQTLGNHDIETGHAVYDKWIGEVDYPMLGANIIDTKTGKPYVKPYTILERDGVRIAILGMLTPAIPCWLSESLWQGLAFGEMVSSARYWMNYLQEHEHPHLVFGLLHSGWDGGIKTPEYDEDAAQRVAREVPGFDVVFFGHDHKVRQEWVVNTAGQRVLCLDPSCNAINVAQANITVELDQCGQLVKKIVDGEIYNVCNEPVDEQMLSHFEPTLKKVREFVERKVGVFEKTISTRDCFFGPSAFTDFILDLQLQITGADISFNAPLNFDMTIEKGPVYMSDMFKLYRYENQIYVMMLSGEEIRKHLEMSYDLWVNTMRSPDDHIMLLNDDANTDMQRYGFKNLTFNFDSAAGIDYEVDVTKPDGQKVRILQMSNGQPFDEKKMYRVAVNSYRGNGGGELLTRGAGIPKEELQKRIVYQSELDQRYYLMKEIERLGTVCPKAHNNWRFVPEAWTREALKRDRKLIFKE